MMGLGLVELAILTGLCAFLGGGLFAVGFVVFAASKKKKSENERTSW